MVENNQKPLFETDDPNWVDPDMPRRIDEAASRHVQPEDKPDATQRWLIDSGSSGRVETLAADTPPTPKSPRKKSPNRNPYARGDGEPRDGEVHQITVEEAAQRPVEPNEEAQLAINAAHKSIRKTRLAKGVPDNIVFTQQHLREDRKS